MNIRPGALEEIAQMINAKSDRELAGFLGITEMQLENIRYGAPIGVLQSADIVRRREAHLRAAELLTTDTAA